MTRPAPNRPAPPPGQTPILVTGGTGTLGRAVVRELASAGREVRVLSRRPQPNTRPPVGWTTGDLRSGTGIDAAVDGAGVIIHCATTNGRGDVAATRRLVEAARRARDPHLVYISIVGVDAVPLFYYRAKLETERLLQSSGLPWTILRTTQFHDLIVWMCSAQRWSPVTVVPAGVSFQPIHVPEVACRLVELATGTPAGRVPDIGGPQVRGAHELARAWSRATGRRRPVLPVRLPGKIFRGYRDGGHLTPKHAVGRVTFEEFLAERFGSTEPDAPTR